MPGRKMGLASAAIGNITLGSVITYGTTISTTLETANLLCGGDICASEIQDANQVIQEQIPIIENTGETVTTVIGRWPANKDLAESIGGNWLNIDMDVWNSMSSVEQWEWNTQWLQEAAIRGDTFLLASDISEAAPGSGFAKELDYLFNNAGYTIFRNGPYLIPPQ